MNTPSHLIITAALRKQYRRTPVVTGAFLLGSIAPDLPLILLTLGGFVYYRYLLGWDSGEAFGYMFDYLYFNDPIWITLHNLLHSPTTVLIGLALLWPARRRIGSPGRWLFWFLAACLLHSIIDVLTHVDDGPYLFFPFNWTIRFHSPVSYWDHRHFGREFGYFELGLNLVLLGYLSVPALWRRLVVRVGRLEG